jgi:hypothetical protein
MTCNAEQRSCNLAVSYISNSQLWFSSKLMVRTNGYRHKFIRFKQEISEEMDNFCVTCID